MSYITECLEKFQDLPDDIREYFGGVETLVKIEKIEARYDKINLDLDFLVVLIVIGELFEEDMLEYLQKKHSIDKEIATNIKNDLLIDIFGKSFFIVKYPEIFDEVKKINLDQEKNIYLTIFQNELIKLLQENLPLKKYINSRIFGLFASDSNFQNKLNDAYFANKEIFFDKEFYLQGKRKVPTIANWVADFTKVKKGGIFSSLDLANYMIDSDNVKILNDNEKEVLKLILYTYRNLHYFPASMPNDTGENWEIIPVALQERGLTKDLTIKQQTVQIESVPEVEKEIYFGEDVVRYDNTHTEDFTTTLLSTSEDKKLIKASKKNIAIKAPEQKKKIPAPKKRKLLFTPGSLKEQMQKVLSGDAWQSTQINEIKTEIGQSEGEDVQKLLNGFQQSKTAEQVVARLEYIAQTEHFKQLLSFIGLKYEELTPENFVKIIKAFLDKRVEKQEVPRFAMRLASILKKHGREDYLKVVYFDKKDQMFKWND